MHVQAELRLPGLYYNSSRNTDLGSIQMFDRSNVSIHIQFDKELEPWNKSTGTAFGNLNPKC